jgi:hypothetical protein
MTWSVERLCGNLAPSSDWNEDIGDKVPEVTITLLATSKSENPMAGFMHQKLRPSSTLACALPFPIQPPSEGPLRRRNH